MGLTGNVMEHRLLERHPTASQARIHRAQRDLERLGNLLAGHVLELEQNEHRTLVEIEAGQRRIEECQIFLALDHRRSVVARVGLDVQIRIALHLVANVGAPAVVLGHAHANPEEPGRQLGSLDEIGKTPEDHEENVLHRVVEGRFGQTEPPERSPNESHVLIVDLLEFHPGRASSVISAKHPLMMMKGSRGLAPSPNPHAKVETGPAGHRVGVVSGKGWALDGPLVFDVKAARRGGKKYSAGDSQPDSRR